MNKNSFIEILNSRVKDFNSKEAEYGLLSKYKEKIKDDDYFDFIILSDNGGFFLNSALHVYGYNDLHQFHDIDFVNKTLHQNYNNITEGLIFFGQDILGNQFAYDTKQCKVVFFNIETGERGIMANNFLSWIKIILSESAYYTGYKLVKEWKIANNLNYDERLSPKIPFILNGEFVIANLYSSPFPKYIQSAAAIAKQVYNLPDGTEFKIIID